MERVDGGRAVAVESAAVEHASGGVVAVEHATTVQAWQRGHDAAHRSGAFSVQHAVVLRAWR
jgi:hypothetical protein